MTKPSKAQLCCSFTLKAEKVETSNSSLEYLSNVKKICIVMERSHGTSADR